MPCMRGLAAAISSTLVTPSAVSRIACTRIGRSRPAFASSWASSRFTMMLHLPTLPGRDGPRIKNGPPVTGSGPEGVRDAIAGQLGGLPEQLRRSLSWDQGAETAQHARLRIDTGLQVFFCDPQSPWQRGTNENTNGLLRQYFPKGTDLARHSPNDLATVADALNSRPRKTLSWRTPAEVLDDHLAAAA